MKRKKYIAPTVDVINLKDKLMVSIGSGTTKPEESEAKKFQPVGEDYEDEEGSFVPKKSYSPWDD